MRPNTKAFFAESIAKPRNSVLDIAGLGAVPYLVRPLEWGADIIVHSATKYLCGHGTVIAGVVVDGGTFDFGAEPKRWPQFHQPGPSYDGLVF